MASSISRLAERLLWSISCRTYGELKGVVVRPVDDADREIVVTAVSDPAVEISPIAGFIDDLGDERSWHG